MKIQLTPYGQDLSAKLMVIKVKGTGDFIPYVSRYEQCLYNYTALTPYQLACLATFVDKWEKDAAWRSEVLQAVNQEFAEYYELEHAPHPVKLQGITFPEPGAQTWELLFEDATEDPLVHVAFDGWTWEIGGMTG